MSTASNGIVLRIASSLPSTFKLRKSIDGLLNAWIMEYRGRQEILT